MATDGTATATDDAAAEAPSRALLYLVLECRRPLAGGARWLIDDVEEVRIGRGPERRSARGEEGARVLSIAVPDGRMSTRHARLARLAGGWAFEDLDSKNGSRLHGIATKRAVLQHGDVIEIGESLFLFALESGLGDLAEAPTVAPGLATLCPAVADEYARLAAVAASEVPVLLLGETGTGKELAARAVHHLSGRKGRFVAINCGALPQSLLEAELFGHRQGAFSGSVESRSGLVRSADRGTLFLDEIGDLALASQAALLRVLQEREVTPIGETTPTRVDVRFVAATHHDVASLSDKGGFRLDLLARLEGYTARLPPLRARRADLGVLVAALLERVAPDRAPRLALHAQAGRALVGYDWPRNVRELELVLKTAVALAADDVVTLAHLPARLQPVAHAVVPEAEPTAPLVEGPAAPLSPEDSALRQRLETMLEQHGGNVNAVTRAMGKDRTQIRRWLRRFGLDAERFR